MLYFGTYLRNLNINPKTVLMILNVGKDFGSERYLHCLAENRRDLLIRYQSYQTPKVEAQMLQKQFLASFIANGNRRALLLDIFRIGENVKHTFEEYWADPLNQKLAQFGHSGFTKEEAKTRPFQRRFELVPIDSHEPDWSGKLVIGWTTPIAWAQHAEPEEKFPILAIRESSSFESSLPDPEMLEIKWNDLEIMPESWKHGLLQWRGVYLIHDASIGKNYVGSAYGSENMLSRWISYAKTGHGGNKHLKALDPSNFVFSVLQLAAPNMPSEEVIRLESSWKNRLHTRYPTGLNEN